MDTSFISIRKRRWIISIVKVGLKEKNQGAKRKRLLTWLLVQESAVNPTDTDTGAAKLKEVR